MASSEKKWEDDGGVKRKGWIKWQKGHSRG